MAKKYLVISVTIIIVCVLLALTQSHTKEAPTLKTVRLHDNKPSVFLEFVKAGKLSVYTGLVSSEGPSLPPTEVVEAVSLRLHNNSRGPIKVRMGFQEPTPKLEVTTSSDKRIVYTPSQNIPVELIYGVEPVNTEVPLQIKLKQNLPYTRIYGSIVDLLIPSGQSVIFPVRREELQRNLQIFVPFEYEWETSEKIRYSDEPEHRVYFTWDRFENAAGIK